jgi:hypothetical protein
MVGPAGIRMNMEHWQNGNWQGKTQVLVSDISPSATAILQSNSDLRYAFLTAVCLTMLVTQHCIASKD